MTPTKLGFGAMRLPKEVDECKKMFASYIESGNNYVDTAYIYEGSEEMVKKALVDQHPRDSFLLANKIPPWEVKSKEDCKRVFEEQLKRCGVDYFDYYLVHSLSVSNEEKALKAGAYEFVEEMKQKGYIKHVGFSFHDSSAVLQQLMDAHHKQIEFVMLQLNYVDILRGPAGEWHKLALKYNKPIMVMEPIKGGTLASLPKEAEDLFKATRPNDSIASWAMRYAASLEGVKTVISGMSTLAQVKDNLRTFNPLEPISEEEYKILNKAIEILGKEGSIPCTGCKYCLVECPMGIAIDSCISLYNEAKRGNEDAKWNRKSVYDSIAQGNKASDCTSCGACLPRCPQHINIPEAMQTVAGEFK